jgi:hypothetical protein
MYNAGVAMYIIENIPFDRENSSAYVVSGGAIGLAVLLYKDPAVLLEKSIGVCKIMGKLKTLGVFAPLHMARICRAGLEFFLPEDAHITLGNRVHVGMTHWPSFQRHTARGPFPTRDRLLEALLTSGFIPLFFMNFPHPDYRNFIDGGFSHAYCKRPELSVITTVAKYTDSDIWNDEGDFHLNLQTADEYMAIFWKGVEDARQKHDVIVEKLVKNGMYRP